MWNKSAWILNQLVFHLILQTYLLHTGRLVDVACNARIAACLHELCMWIQRMLVLSAQCKSKMNASGTSCLKLGMPALLPSISTFYQIYLPSRPTYAQGLQQ